MYCIIMYYILYYILYCFTLYTHYICVYVCIYEKNIYIYIYMCVFFSTLSHCCHIESVHYVAHPSLVCTKEPHWCKVSMRFLLRKRDHFWVHVPDVPFWQKKSNHEWAFQGKNMSEQIFPTLVRS